MTTALEGLRVLDLSRVLAGPWAGQILGDLGADVIKVERPEVGDDARELGVRPTTPDGRPVPSSMFLVANRNKRSLSVDFTKSAGAELIRKLVLKSDVVIENFLPGTLAKYGLDHLSLSRINPRLIYCSITGYGQDGPYRSRPGYDGVFQAEGGLMSVTGLPDGVPGGGPMKAGPSVVDVTAGYVAAVAILAALRSRERTGLGQRIDTALLDSVLSLQSTMVQTYLTSRRPLQRSGTTGNGGHPSQVFECADGPIYITAGKQSHYEALCRVLGLNELIDDPRFTNNRLRLLNRDAWNQVAGPIIASLRRRHLLDALIAAHVPAGPVADHHEVFADEHVRTRELEISMENPEAPGAHVSMLASPFRLSGTPVHYRLRPPRVGEHTEEIVTGLLGLSEADLELYRREGVV